MIRGIGDVLFLTSSQTLNGKDPEVTLINTLGPLTTLRGPHSASRTGDEG